LLSREYRSVFCEITSETIAKGEGNGKYSQRYMQEKAQPFMSKKARGEWRGGRALAAPLSLPEATTGNFRQNLI